MVSSWSVVEVDARPWHGSFSDETLCRTVRVSRPVLLGFSIKVLSNQCVSIGIGLSWTWRWSTWPFRIPIDISPDWKQIELFLSGESRTPGGCAWRCETSTVPHGGCPVCLHTLLNRAWPGITLRRSTPPAAAVTTRKILFLYRSPSYVCRCRFVAAIKTCNYILQHWPSL